MTTHGVPPPMVNFQKPQYNQTLVLVVFCFVDMACILCHIFTVILYPPTADSHELSYSWNKGFVPWAKNI